MEQTHDDLTSAVVNLETTVLVELPFRAFDELQQYLLGIIRRIGIGA